MLKIEENYKINDKKLIINFTEGKEKTLLKIGYINIYLENKFNCLQKKIFKYLLGIKIEDIVKKEDK